MRGPSQVNTVMKMAVNIPEAPQSYKASGECERIIKSFKSFVNDTQRQLCRTKVETYRFAAVETACFGFFPPRGRVMRAALTFARLANSNQRQVERFVISRQWQPSAHKGSLLLQESSKKSEDRKLVNPEFYHTQSASLLSSGLLLI